MKKFSTIFTAIMLTIAWAASAGCTAKKGDESASTPSAPAHITAFSADSAYRFVADQTALGPRVPGSEAHALCRQYIIDKLRSYGADVATQDTSVITHDGNRMPVRNVTGVFNGTAKRRVMLLAHYDTRPWADRDPNPANERTPIDGANDGGSGVAVMLEIARNIGSMPKDVAVEMLFVDAEDSGSYNDDESWCIGSQVWASTRRVDAPAISYALLLDMVGGKGAVFHREYFSDLYAPAVVDNITRTARRLGLGDRFPESVGAPLNDDHIPLLQIGIPAVDIVECANAETGGFNPTWHTMADNLDNIDPATLKAVGDVVINTIYNR